MADVVWSVLVVLAGAAAVLLGHRAVRHWWAERAGRVYELPVDRNGTVLRAGAAGTAALLAGVLALPLLGGGPNGASGSGTTRVSADGGKASGVPAPPAPRRTPQPAPPPPALHTLGYPAGGTLDQLADGTRVWLPPWYASPRGVRVAFPVAVAHLPAEREADLFDGFALALRRGLADPFVLVLPADCARGGAALAAAGRHFRVLPARGGTGVIGVGAGAPCAVNAALATTGRYGAAAGVSGLYPPLAASSSSRTAPPPLLLASAPGETAAQTAARRLRTALRPRGADDVRLVDGVPVRRELFAQIAGYLTEKLDGPAAIATPPASPAPANPRGGPAS
ncbi:hypothetical protein [Streptomyces sp. NRRL F-5123]|uniref:hypothetical protein n=1 Tax=Streptomyces sp. NRRL F-5123 TaxID=1463856 RepID=UPI00069446FA|nr:hypothetical protein [Streptomyces sp. NRRL F-5123]